MVAAAGGAGPGAHDRPFLVIGADRFADALFGRIADPGIAGLPRVGAADQFLDSTDALGDAGLVRAVVATALGLPDGA